MAKTITEQFASACDRPPESIAIRFKRQKNWLNLTWRDYFRQTESVAMGLRGFGVRPGDRVAILSNTRWEWATLDFAILGLGATTVPIYQSSRAEEVEYILNNSQSKILILEDAVQLRKWESIAKKCPSVTQLILIHRPEDPLKPSHGRELISYDDLCERGAESAFHNPGWFMKSCHAVDPSQTASLVYTSGTTGEPKGVVITHEQIMGEVEGVAKVYPVSSQDCTLTFLPYAHVLGRVELWLHTHVGFTLAFAESIDRLKKNLLEIRPTAIIGVPRIFEKIHAGIEAEIQGHPLRKQILEILDQPFVRTMPNAVSSLLKKPGKMLMDALIFRKLRAGLGGRLRFSVSGGAPLDPGVAAFFKKAGVLLLEGYGLTETTGAIVVNTPVHYKFGTVGRPLPGVEIKLANDGEILVKGPMVMQSYFQNVADTENVIDKGFFKTGDVGEWTEDGYLRITDRKKDLIKTAAGKYIAPQKLEGLLKLNPLISNVLIHGDKKKYIVALITLDESTAKSRARAEGWRFRDYRSLTQSNEAREAVQKIIAGVNAQLANHETIKAFSVLPQDFTVESGELTPSLKVKRQVADQNYKEIIDSLY